MYGQYTYGTYHTRITIYYVKIASQFEIGLALTATVSLSPRPASFCLHARAYLFDLATYIIIRAVKRDHAGAGQKEQVLPPPPHLTGL